MRKSNLNNERGMILAEWEKNIWGILLLWGRNIWWAREGRQCTWFSVCSIYFSVERIIFRGDNFSSGGETFYGKAKDGTFSLCWCQNYFGATILQKPSARLPSRWTKTIDRLAAVGALVPHWLLVFHFLIIQLERLDLVTELAAP